MQALRKLFKSTSAYTTHRSGPTTTFYDQLIHKAGLTRNFRRVRKFLDKRINDGCQNSKETFNFITKTQASIDMLDELFECLASLPRGAPRRSAYYSLVMRLCKLELTENALKVLDEMRQRDIEINACLFHPVFGTLVEKQEMGKARELLEVMGEVGVEPDISSYNFVLRGYCMEGDVVHAVDLLGEMMGKEGLRGDAKTYDSMVLGACKAGMVEGAMAVLRAAVDDGVKVMYSTYEHVIRALLEAGYYEQAVKFVMCFAGKNHGLDNENFNFLAIGLIRLERYEEVGMVLDEMIKRRLDMVPKLRDFQKSHAPNWNRILLVLGEGCA